MVYAVEEETIIVYFIDVTDERWVENDSAAMVLIDNSHNHRTYDMELTGEYTWIAEVPKSAENITFNRYDKTGTVQWNSFSAGGRNGKNIYLAQGSEYGCWVLETEYGLKKGNNNYLNVTEVQDCMDKEDNTLHTNFNTAAKSDNSDNDVTVEIVDSTLYKPYAGLD